MKYDQEPARRPGRDDPGTFEVIAWADMPAFVREAGRRGIEVLRLSDAHQRPGGPSRVKALVDATRAKLDTWKREDPEEAQLIRSVQRREG